MLRTFLTPLRARFDVTPRLPPENASEPQEDEQTPEDFTRDVLVELMRNRVEELKQSASFGDGKNILTEIRSIMGKCSYTKDVFREMDGFVCLYNVLSTTCASSGGDHQSTEDDTLEIVRLVLEVLSEATYEHHQNARFYKREVGYEPLAHALQSLCPDAKTTLDVLGLLLSFILHDFSIEPLFKNLSEAEIDSVDDVLVKFDENFRYIHHPDVLSLLWTLHQRVWTRPTLRYGLSKLLGRLANASHRNLAAMSNAGLVMRIFEHFHSSGDESVTEKERHAWQRLLRRLLELGAAPDHARAILQKTVKEDNTLDSEMLDLIRYGVKSRWVDHFSMEHPSSIVVADSSSGVLPPSGITFMAWIFLTQMPTEVPLTLFNVIVDSKSILRVSIRSDGKFEVSSSSNRNSVTFSKATIRKSRWAHVALVHYPNRTSNPSIRLFLDGVIQDGVNWDYPKPDHKALNIKYSIGDAQSEKSPGWCLSSVYLIALPIFDDLIRLIHHLGPRYTGHFQDSALMKFLTYEASTSLNMFLASANSKTASHNESPRPQILKAMRNGVGFNETHIVFSLNATSLAQAGVVAEIPTNGILSNSVARGDVYVVKAACLDYALWTIGGAVVGLRLVQLAHSAHELSRTLGILTDCLKNNWQNSEDMERMRGYEILADMLHRKSQHINLTSFEIVFEFLGINPRTPEQSTIVNTDAYRAIALDFELWSRTREEIQIVYLDHFRVLLETSRYKNFNITQRFSKLNLVRKVLFVLQTNWFADEMVNKLVETLGVICRADFSRDGAIKPVVSYLAANLHEELAPVGSPRSTFSRLDVHTSRGKSEQVLQTLVTTLCTKQFFNKFIAALPLTRICLLLLGNNPSPLVAAQILKLLDISIGFSTSFIRKFELVNGWSVLKTVLPHSWSGEVNDAAFSLLCGRSGTDQKSQETIIQCPQIFPTILAALQSGLGTVASTSHVPEDSDTQSILLNPPPTTELGSQPNPVSSDLAPTIEALAEELLNLHSTSVPFRSIFQSQVTTQVFVDGYKAYVKALAELPEINARALRILEKVTHFGLALALDNLVAGSQKREIMDVMPTAERIMNPSTESTTIDPSLVADNRTVRQRITSAKFSLQVGERTIFKILARIGEWRKTIQVSEKKRLRKSILDLRETRRQVSQLHEWTHILTSERGLWSMRETRLWRLDETEGPNRIRMKLEAEMGKGTISGTDVYGINNRDIRAPDVEAIESTTEVPPWAESYEVSSTEDDDPSLSENIVDDKLRRVRHELQPGDVIDAVATVARIAGVDSSPGLLIIGRTHLYMLDGVVESDDGEIIDAHDAPKRLLFVPGSVVELDGPQKAQRWAHHQITSYSEKSFLFRDVALELYFKDSRSLLLVFLDRKLRADINQRLTNILNKNSLQTPSTPGILRTPVSFGRPPPSQNSRSFLGFKPDDLGTATRRWQAREISNFTYISILNQVSGRTPSDATQYPVFPWVLQDYTSEILDLTKPSSYRDLTKPMGALTSARREAARTRYENLESVDEKPFHYGTHFSSSMIVCHFLIRVAPYTNMFKTLQGGDWDLPDRLFSDISRAYESAAQDTRGDVRELIPEFFTCPEFLENSANHDFGVQQNTGEKIHDVKLPPWAKRDPLLFIVLHRRALESDYISENLHAWIDLIWGCKQKDPASLNVFHPLSYEGAINLDEITDELEREATVGIIHNFGQTPRKLFSVPHPPRYNHGLQTLPLGTLHGIEEDSQLLKQATRCFRDLGPNTPVKELLLDPMSDKVIPCPQNCLIVPMYPHEKIEWIPEKREVRVLVDHKVEQVVENIRCTCATFVDSDNLVMGLGDYTVRQWKLLRSPPSSLTPSPATNPKLSLTLGLIMRIHTDEITCIIASRTWSIIVSGSRDGSAAIWELNKGGYVRSIWHPKLDADASPVVLVAINESTGYIASCSNLSLLLHTVNGRPIAALDLTALPSYYSPHSLSVTSLAFHEREYSYMGLLGTGAPDGTITLWTWEHKTCELPGTHDSSEAPLWNFVEVRRMRVRSLANGRPPCITALRFSGEKLYHGEETGKCFAWNLPDSD